LQWRDPNDDPAAITDGAHRALVEGARTCGFEEFKRALVEAARRKPPVPKIRMPQVSVFVNADREDLDVARQLSVLLAKQGVEC
jgi:hypothetical protein